MTRREDLAWAAGFIDGEGCIGAYRHGRYHYAGLYVGQVEREPLDRLQRILGCGTVTARQPTTTAKRPSWFFQIQNFEQVQAAIASLWAWLSPPKQGDAYNALLKVRMA